MKKLLLAATLLASISATAMATNTSVLLDSAKSASVTVSAHYVKPLEITLDLATINFGDVYTDSVISDETVTATITGTQGETFTYTVSTNGSLVKINGGVAGATYNGAQTGFTGGTVDLTFDVGLNTAGLSTDTDVSEIVTMTVTYDSIADTSTTGA